MIENRRPLRLRRERQPRHRRDDGELRRSIANPDAVAEPGAVAALVAFTEAHPRCGIAGPQMLYPDGTLAAVAPAVSHRRRDARAADAAAPALPAATSAQRDHYPSTSGRPSPSRPTGCSAPSCSCAATMLDELGGFDAGYRLYGEDIDLCYRAAQAGWERWYVPGGGRRPRATPP